MAREIPIEPPLAGWNRRVGYQRRPPFSSYTSTNYWPFDVDTGRAVTATRPGQVDYTSPGATVNFLSLLNGSITGKPTQSILAGTSGTLFWWDGNIWQAAGGAAASLLDTGRAVYGRSFLEQTFIMVAGNPPILFDYELETAEYATASAGAFPEDCRMAEVWQQSLCLAGDTSQPDVLFMSRSGNPRDYDFGVASADEGGAFFTAGDNSGLITGPITAIFGHTADSMIVSTLDGIRVMRGHPRRGGIFEQVSNNLYILGQGAWARAPGDTVFMLTQQGLATLDPTPGAIPALVSRDAIPDELIALPYDYEDPTVAMAYDTRWNVIYITVRGASKQWWLYDLNAGGFHKMDFGASNAPYVMLEFTPAITDDASGVLWGIS